MNSERDILTKALSEIASGSRRSKIARLREIFDDVEAAKAAGAGNKIIVAALAAHGLIFDVNNFKNARSRIMKERVMKALARSDKTSSQQTIAPPTKDKNSKTSGAAKPAAAQEKTPIDPKPVGGGRPIILSGEKGLFGKLKPGPVDGTADFNQKNGVKNGN